MHKTPKKGYGSIPTVDSQIHNCDVSEIEHLTNRSTKNQPIEHLRCFAPMVVVGWLALVAVITNWNYPSSWEQGHSNFREQQTNLLLNTDALVNAKSTTADDSDTGTLERTFPSPTDVGLHVAERSSDLQPSKAWGSKLLQHNLDQRRKPLPTNIWYLNLLSQMAGTEYNAEASRVYTVPYIIDTVGTIPGIRVHNPVVQASDRNMQMVVDAENSLTLGAAPGAADPHYSVATDEWSLLGLSLAWNSTKDNSDSSMTAHIVRGMPYATMEYSGWDMQPMLESSKYLASDILIDSDTDSGNTLECGILAVSDDWSSAEITYPNTVQVQREMLLHFKESDFTWVLFVSRPVRASCMAATDPEVAGTPPDPGMAIGTKFQLRLFPYDNIVETQPQQEQPLVVRLALVNECTTGKSTIHAHCDPEWKMDNPAEYLMMLRGHAGIFPTGNPNVDIEFPKESHNTSHVTFDWEPKTFQQSNGIMESSDQSESKELLMFALPHHQEMMEPINGVSTNVILKDFCKATFHGPACLVRGRKWSLLEKLEPSPSFYAARPPEASAIPTLANALMTDIQYQLPSNLHRAAADTYFSGKILSRVARVILIALELQDLAASEEDDASTSVYGEDVDPEWYASSVKAAKAVTLPSEDLIQQAISRLREGVEAWINGKGEAPYVYDSTWGGLVNCGCNYTLPEGSFGDQGYCFNKYPNCPALTDVNVDFGNGYYNDHHYHYGYHIYAAAVVAKLDPAWGVKWFDQLMLYVRDIGNDSKDDPFFPQFRHKDWYLGSSWASGLASFNEVHGRNQESSSEAIAAYEGMALFGRVWNDAQALHPEMKVPNHVLSTGQQVHRVGSLLMSTELHATQRYWHVWNSTKHVNTYPSAYTKPVVGMMYETMGSFQTWFSGGDMASIGIQLLPFTPAAEARDDPDWVTHAYPAFNASCVSNLKFCVQNGWSVILSGLEATIGNRKQALRYALEIPASVFASEGGCGHSLSNTVWYVATRPDPNAPHKWTFE